MYCFIIDNNNSGVINNAEIYKPNSPKIRMLLANYEGSDKLTPEIEKQKFSYCFWPLT